MKKISYTNANDLDLSNGVVLVKYSATWCPYCKNAIRRDEALFAKQTEITIYEVDMGDYDDELSWQKMHVSVVPSYRLYKDGKDVTFLSGPQTDKNIEQAIENILK